MGRNDLQGSISSVGDDKGDDYQLCDGIYRPPSPVQHRDDEYDNRGFEMLARMQREHFWYLGRRRFVLHGIHRWLAAEGMSNRPLRVIDLGGGCGGWMTFLAKAKRFTTAELALADSSESALRHAEADLPVEVSRYQIDLLDLHWRDRWDLSFLLDVLEHIPQQESALRHPRRPSHRRLARRHRARPPSILDSNR